MNGFRFRVRKQPVERHCFSIVVGMHIPDRAILRQRGTEKWSSADPDMVPMFVAESDFQTHPHIRAAIDAAVRREKFGYPNAHDTRLGKAVAEFCATRYLWQVAPEWVFPIADVVRGVWMAIEKFSAPGSAIAFATPAYPPFFTLGELAGRPHVTIDMRERTLDLEAIAAAFAAGADDTNPAPTIGAFVLCNPHNPLGVAFDANTLRELADLAAQYDVKIISDEIHAPLVFGRNHIPAASVSETAAAVTITLMAASKAWNIAGLKCAQLIVSNAQDAARWEAIPETYHNGYSILGYEASLAAYSADQEFLAEQLDYLAGNFDYLEEHLPQAAPGVRFDRPNATYLAWLDFRDTVLGTDAARLLLDEAKVWVSDGRMFLNSDAGGGFVRMNLGCSRDTLDEAIGRIARLVAKHS